MKIDPDISLEGFISQYENSYAWYGDSLVFIRDIRGLDDFTLTFIERKNTPKIYRLSHKLIHIRKPIPRWVALDNSSYYYVSYLAPRHRLNGINYKCLRIYPNPPFDLLVDNLIIEFLSESPKYFGAMSWEYLKQHPTVLVTPQLLWSGNAIYCGKKKLYPNRPEFEPYLASIIPNLPRTKVNETNRTTIL